MLAITYTIEQIKQIQSDDQKQANLKHFIESTADNDILQIIGLNRFRNAVFQYLNINKEK